MKHIEIVDESFKGEIKKIRIASRAIIIKDDEILLSYEKKTNQYMIPGGGKETDEEISLCAKREVREETGFIIDVSECMLKLDEYYSSGKYISYYFFGSIVGETKRCLTEGEKLVGMEPKWVKISEIIDIFSKYQEYEKSDPMRFGLYKREYMALKELL